MDQASRPTTSVNCNLSQATIGFLAKHKAYQKAKDTSLKAKNATLDAELSRLIAPDPPMDVEIDWRHTDAAGNADAAKDLVRIVRDFDVEVGRTQERDEVEKEMKQGLEDIRKEKVLAECFKATIARYKARDG